MIIMIVIMLTRLIPCTMGANASQLEKDIGSDLFPANEHYFGLVCIFRVFRVPCVTPTHFVHDTVILTCIGPSYVFSGEFREHMLLKLCSSSTLLLQAFQRKGTKNTFSFDGCINMVFHLEGKISQNKSTLYDHSKSFLCFENYNGNLDKGASVQCKPRCLSTRPRTNGQRKPCSLAWRTSSIPLSHRRERFVQKLVLRSAAGY